MSNSRYAKLEVDSEAGDDESLLQNTTAPSTGTNKNKSSHFRSSIHALVTVVLVCIAFGMGTLVQSLPFLNKDSLCAAHTVQYSPPLLSDVDIKYSTVSYNGSFLQENIYRQDAGPAVDAAWEALGVNYGAIRVPDDQAAAAGIDPHTHVRINDKYGGGYPANVEGLHHLHCLNLLRQSSFYNFDHYRLLGEGAFKNDDHILKLHVTHCLDILRQQLMCRVDVGVFGQVWTNPDRPKAFVDFNTDHKCVNYDAVRRWAEDRQLPKEAPEDFLAPPEDRSVVLPGTP